MPSVWATSKSPFKCENTRYSRRNSIIRNFKRNSLARAVRRKCRHKKGSKNVVEFAVKLPSDDDKFIYLPIDSKFPGDTYAALRDAIDEGDKIKIDLAAKALITRIKSEAKDIHDKYIDPPYTTEFAIMFLPFEGLYSEAVNRGLVEILQRDYKVNIAGPSTMAALLNSLQMGFKTLAVQKEVPKYGKF